MTTVVKNENITYTSIKIDPRTLTKILRWFEVNVYTVSQKISEYKDYESKWDRDAGDSGLWIKSWVSTSSPFSCDLQITQDDDEYDLNCYIYLNRKHEIHNFTIYYKNEDFESVYDREYLDQFDCLTKEYKICKCDNLCAHNKDQCEDCYINDYENDERCSICFENNYAWIQITGSDGTGCNHKFHKHCIEKIGNNKCPLCRARFCKYDDVTEL